MYLCNTYVGIKIIFNHFNQIYLFLFNTIFIKITNFILIQYIPLTAELI